MRLMSGSAAWTMPAAELQPATDRLHEYDGCAGSRLPRGDGQLTADIRVAASVLKVRTVRSLTDLPAVVCVLKNLSSSAFDLVCASADVS